MGNRFIYSCFPDSSNLHNGAISFRLSNQTYYMEKVPKVQAAFRKFLTKRKVNEMNKEMFKQFEQIVGPENVDLSKIINKRGDKLNAMDQKFNLDFGNFCNNLKDRPYTEEKLLFKKKTVELKSYPGDIYEGFWRYDSINETFYRGGYGRLYREDGSVVEGIWNDSRLLGDGRIYFSNGRIYEGETLSEESSKTNHSHVYFAHGKGTMYKLTDRGFKTIKGTFERNLLNGEVLETLPGKFTLKVAYKLGCIINKGVFIYPDNSRYEGEFDIMYRPSGFGVMHYANCKVYEGYWKKGKYNGHGVVYSPNFSKSSSEKKGSYTKGNWIEGLLTGEGTITTNNHITNCVWRFGKLILSAIKLSSSNNVNLHSNIFNFLTTKELENLLKIKNRDIIYYFTKNKNENLIKLRLMQMMMFDSKFYLSKNLNSNKLISKFILQNISKIKNMDEVLINYLHDKSQFIPILAYKSNGGLVEKRFHYSNLFNPDFKKAFSSNYFIQKKNDIEVCGVISPKFIESEANLKVNRINFINNFEIEGRSKNSFSNEMKNNFITISSTHGDANSINIKGNNISNRKEIKKLLMKFQMNIRERDEEGIKLSIDSLKSTANEYTSLYKESFKDYKIDFYQIKVEDDNVLKASLNKIGEDKQRYYFSIHQILIDIPIKFTMYTVLSNPVRTLAVYIHNSPITTKDIEREDILNYNSISEYQISQTVENNINYVNTQNLESYIEQIRSTGKYSIMKIHQCEKKVVIEFDTQTDREGKKLLALIILKDYSVSHLINVKNYYHMGKFVTVRLIDQTAAFNSKITGIDVGTIIFSGQVYSLEN